MKYLFLINATLPPAPPFLDLRGGQVPKEPNPSLLPCGSAKREGGGLNFTEFLDAKGIQKLQKKDFPALEGGGRGWVKSACPPLNLKGEGHWEIGDECPVSRGTHPNTSVLSPLPFGQEAGGWVL